MTDRSEWLGRVGEAWSEEWRRTDRSFGPVTERLLARTREFAPSRIVDIGCGAGELAIAIARGNPHARITGVDVSPRLVEVAQERGSRHPNVEFLCADAAAWEARNGRAPDLLVSRHGAMFFDDPPAAFAHLAGQAADRANLLFSCFRAPGENAFFSEVVRLLPDPPLPGDPYAPGPFAFADKDRVTSVLEAGGWGDIAFEPFDYAMIVGGGEDPVEDAVGYFARIGPAARAAAEMDVNARERFLGRVRNLAERHLHDGLVCLRAATWIVTAQKR